MPSVRVLRLVACKRARRSSSCADLHHTIHILDASGKASNSSPHGWTPTSLYSMWIGVHIMMIFGFGNLMTFLHRYGYSATGYTFVMTCLGTSLKHTMSACYV